jgi:LPXTG-site transpeptidase (sortase) family protein
MQNKEHTAEQLSPKQRMFGLGIALLVPISSIIIAILLVKKGINITEWIKNWSRKPSGDLLGESVSKDSQPKQEKFSAFKKNLEPIIVNPASMSIKSIGLNASLVPVGLDDAGVMETPDNWMEAGWYIKGGMPGEPKNLIINGHYDTNTGAPAAFYNLKNLGFGDVIEVKDKYGRIFNYKVVILSYLDVKDPSRLDVLRDEEGKSTLTLITCSGEYLWESGYNKRLVVKAELLE